MPMDASESPDDLAVTAKETGESIYREVLDTLLSGIAITIPLVITVYVLSLALDVIGNALRPLIDLLEFLGVIDEIESVFLVRLLVQLDLYTFVLSFLSELITIAILVGFIFLVGTVGRNTYGERVIDYVDLAITSIPGVGAVYKSFRRMGDVMLNEEAENFQSVKMVRCFGDEMYVLGFKTSDAPETVEDSTNNQEMVAMFLPLAPNPVTGGFLTYIPKRDVIDIDMTIEEGVRSILTSGIATGEGAQQPRATVGDLSTITDLDLQDALATGEHDANEDAGSTADTDPGQNPTSDITDTPTSDTTNNPTTDTTNTPNSGASHDPDAGDDEPGERE